MSMARVALASVAAFVLLLAGPTQTGFGPDLAFGKGGGNGGGGGHDSGGGHGGGGSGGSGGGASAGGAGSAGAGASGAGSGAAGGGNGGTGSAAGGNGGGGDGNNGSSLAAFRASPVFGHVAATVPTTITATPVVVSRLGVPCQTMTQTINIGGQNVHASAVLCRQPNGEWQIKPTQSARMGNATQRSGLPGGSASSASATSASRFSAMAP